MSIAMDEVLLRAYLPTDRYQSLVSGQPLPETGLGVVLFADIVGFTPLTESLAAQWGARQGAEELTRVLNLVYKALITEIHRYGGSVIYFSGDAITCWFGVGIQEDLEQVVRQATTSAFALQEAVQSLGFPETESPHPISIKIALASGTVRRFVVGNPAIQLFDVIAGAPLEQVAQTEHLARPGEILATPTVCELLAEQVNISEWRQNSAENCRAAVFGKLNKPADPCPYQLNDPPPHLYNELRSWLLPAIGRGLEQGLTDFLTELRPVAALFMRFTGLNFVDDAQVGAKLNEFICYVQNILQEFGGNLIQLTIGEKGSYLYAAFGAPIAHQNDAERAIGVTRRLLETRPPDLTITLGLSYGTMRTGAYGCTERATFGVLGDEVNLAARLMIAAPPNSALFSSRLYKMLAGQINCRSLTPLKIKGKLAPVGVYELLTEQLPLPPPSLVVQQLPFVGRADELAILAKAGNRLARGTGQLVIITGEAGLGKSRLVAEFGKRLGGAAFYRAESQSYAMSSPYLGWQPIFRELLDVRTGEQLKTEISRLGLNLNARLPLLNPLLGLNLPDNEFTARLEPDLRKNLLEALAVELLKSCAAAQQRPLVLVLENCQWLDQLSQSLLTAVNQNLADMPVLLLLTYRTEPDNNETEFLNELPKATHLRLTGLPNSQIHELLAHKIAQRVEQSDDPESRAKLVERVEGNPFYLEELVNVLFSEAVGGKTTNSFEAAELPDSLHGLILSHLDSLGETEKALLKVASVIGRTFQADWLTEIPALPANLAQIEQTLARLVAANLILQQPDGYAFKHGLTQEIIYQSLLGAHKKILHEVVGQLVEQKSAATALPLDLLAYHFGRSSNSAKQRRYWRLAGQQAQANYANPPAIQYYSQLVALLNKHKQAAGDLAATPTELIQEWFEINHQLSRVLHSVGRWDDAAEICHTALARLSALASQNELAIAAEWLSEKRTQYQLALCSNLIAANQFGEARQYAEEVRKTEKRPIYLADALARLGWITLLQDEYEKAIDYLQQSLVLFRQLDDQPRAAGALKNLGVAACKLQLWEQARQHLEESLSLYRQIADRQGIAATLDSLAVLLIDQLGELDSAQQYLEEGLALNRKMGNRRAMAYNLNNLGVIADRRGDYTQAHKYYEAQLVLRRDLNDAKGLVLALYNVGAIAINYLKDFELAEKYYQEAWQISQAGNHKFGQAISLAGLGCLRHIQQNYPEALQKLRQVVSLSLEIKAYSYTLPTLVLIATVLAAENKQLDLEQAAQLCGCLATHNLTSGVLDTLLDTPNYNVYATTLQTIRAQLDETVFEANFALGQQTPLADCQKLLPQVRD